MFIFIDYSRNIFPLHSYGQYEVAAYVFYEYYYRIPSYFLGFIFYQCIYGFIPV